MDNRDTLKAFLIADTKDEIIKIMSPLFKKDGFGQTEDEQKENIRKFIKFFTDHDDLPQDLLKLFARALPHVLPHFFGLTRESKFYNDIKPIMIEKYPEQKKNI